MDALSSRDRSGHVAHQIKQLRTIVASAKNALDDVERDVEKTALVRARTYRLLMEFEHRVLADGRNAAVLEAIGTAREELAR